MLRAAITIADSSGIEALTMRRLAEELGAEAMSLYYYLANKISSTASRTPSWGRSTTS